MNCIVKINDKFYVSHSIRSHEYPDAKLMTLKEAKMVAKQTNGTIYTNYGLENEQIIN